MTDMTVAHGVYDNREPDFGIKIYFCVRKQVFFSATEY